MREGGRESVTTAPQDEAKCSSIIATMMSTTVTKSHLNDYFCGIYSLKWLVFLGHKVAGNCTERAGRTQGACASVRRLPGATRCEP